MKKALLLLFLVSAFIGNAQNYYTPFANSNEYFSQMWNTSNTYYGTVPILARTGLGNQIDTGTNTTVFSVYTSQLNKAVVTATVDTFVPYPISGYGSITMTAYILKCTNTPTVTATPVASLDGVHWETIPGVTAGTAAPTSLTVPVNLTWVFPLQSGTFGGRLYRFYGISFAGTGTSTYSVQSYIYFIKPPDPGKLR